MARTRYRRDRTAGRAADAALHRALFAAIADAILVVDGDARYRDVNPAAVALLGFSRDELLALRVPDLVARDDTGMTAAAFAAFKRDGVWRGELELRRKDGTTVPTEGLAVPVPLPTGTVYVTVTRDITDRRAHERRRGEFLSLVSHEVRTPLTAVTGYLDMMQRRGAYDERWVRAALAQARLLGKLVADALEAARLDTGHHALRRGPVDLVALAGAAVGEMRGLSDRHTIAVEVGRPAVVGHWDGERLRQVLDNLLLNALRHTPGGAVVIRVDGDGERARVAVRDAGPGIPAEALPGVFDRFVRGPTATTGSLRGFGLGLWVARGLVEEQGGALIAESDPATGSTFAFTLPYGAPEDARRT